MTHRQALPLSMEQLTEDWRIWINDSSLQSTQRFGQYVLNKRLARGYAWPWCYYANTTEAYKLLFNWINESNPKEQPKLTFH